MLWNDQRHEMLEETKRDCAADAHALAQGRPTPHEARWGEERLRCRCLHSCPRIATEANCSRRAEPRKDLKAIAGLTPELSRRVSGRPGRKVSTQRRSWRDVAHP
jgi:hypothetical protein